MSQIVVKSSFAEQADSESLGTGVVHPIKGRRDYSLANDDELSSARERERFNQYCESIAEEALVRFGEDDLDDPRFHCSGLPDGFRGCNVSDDD